MDRNQKVLERYQPWLMVKHRDKERDGVRMSLKYKEERLQGNRPPLQFPGVTLPCPSPTPNLCAAAHTFGVQGANELNLNLQASYRLKLGESW